MVSFGKPGMDGEVIYLEVDNFPQLLTSVNSSGCVHPISLLSDEPLCTGTSYLVCADGGQVNPNVYAYVWVAY